MPEAIDLRLSGRGLHPSHFAALRTEILRTGDELSHEQLRDLADALQRQIRVRRSGRTTRRVDAWVAYEPRTFA